MVELQVMACVFGSTYAFHLIAECLTVCPFCGFFFVRSTVFLLQGFEVTYPIFEISMKLRTRLPDAFYHLVANDNFYCQARLKNAKFDLLGSKTCQLANLVANRDWLIVTVLQATVCIFLQLAITAAWQRTSVVGLYRIQLFYLRVNLSISHLIIRLFFIFYRSQFKMWARVAITVT